MSATKSNWILNKHFLFPRGGQNERQLRTACKELDVPMEAAREWLRLPSALVSPDMGRELSRRSGYPVGAIAWAPETSPDERDQSFLIEQIVRACVDISGPEHLHWGELLPLAENTCYPFLSSWQHINPNVSQPEKPWLMLDLACAETNNERLDVVFVRQQRVETCSWFVDVAAIKLEHDQLIVTNFSSGASRLKNRPMHHAMGPSGLSDYWPGLTVLLQHRSAEDQFVLRSSSPIRVHAEKWLCDDAVGSLLRFVDKDELHDGVPTCWGPLHGFNQIVLGEYKKALAGHWGGCRVKWCGSRHASAPESIRVVARKK